MARRIETNEAIREDEKIIGWIETKFITRECLPVAEGGDSTFGQLVDATIEGHRQGFGRELLALTVRFPEAE